MFYCLRESNLRMNIDCRVISLNILRCLSLGFYFVSYTFHEGSFLLSSSKRKGDCGKFNDTLISDFFCLKSFLFLVRSGC